jgi:hypothetical protein
MSQDKSFYVVRESGYAVVVDTDEPADALFVAMSIRQQKGTSRRRKAVAGSGNGQYRHSEEPARVHK